MIGWNSRGTMRVLVVEDEIKMADALARGLRRVGYAVDLAQDGEEAIGHASVYDYDAIVLDVMLPGQDGFQVCRDLRGKEKWPPVLMLTARDGVEDRIRGLDSGADDYLVKPFAFDELLARLRALLRRHPGERPARIVVGVLLGVSASHTEASHWLAGTIAERGVDCTQFMIAHCD